MKEDYQITAARKEFCNLLIAKDPLECAERVRTSLLAAGKDYDALDPSGTKTNMEMAQEFIRRYNDALIYRAQISFDRLSVTGFVGFSVTVINDYLAEAGKDYAALDPTGRKTSAEMEQELDRRHDASKIRLAQEHFDTLLTTDSPVCYITVIDKLLQETGKNYAALDATGKKSAKEIEKEITKRKEAGLVRSARKQFNDLLITEEPHRCIATLCQLLADAHKDYSTLDPTGNKSQSEMGQEVNQRYRDAVVRYTRPFLRLLPVITENPAAIAGAIHDCMLDVGPDYSVLDETGRKTSAEIKKDINRYTKQRPKQRIRGNLATLKA